MILAAFAVLFLVPLPASAHAFVEKSDPAANSILATAPTQMTIWFTERLEPKSTSATLSDHLGNTIPGTSFRIGDDPKVLIVTLPPGLANGTYSVVWKNISEDDGHPAKGYIPFTIGTAADIQTIVAPADSTGSAGAPEWLRAGSRWLAFLGLFLAVALWPVWSLVLAPAARRVPGGIKQSLPTITRLAVIAIAAALIGDLAALLVQAAESGGSYFHDLKTTLIDTRYGELWMLRVGLLGLLAALLSFVNWVWPWRRAEFGTFAFIASLALVVPFSLNAHASAQTSGRAFAIATDMVHLAAAGIWGGGAILLLIVLGRAGRGLNPERRRAFAAAAIPRFSMLALSAWILLVATGAYSAWLEVANIDGARNTDYGNAFLVKMALAALLLGFGAAHLIVVSRKIKQSPAGTPWARRFQITLGIEVAAIVAILLVTGWLTSQAPARESLAQTPQGTTVALAANGINGTLTLNPGSAGVNHLLLQLDGGNIPADAEALLRLTAPDAAFGTQEITLTSTGGNSWETHGSQFSLAGDWSVTAIVRKIGEFQWQATGPVTIAAASAAASGPGEPWHFGTSALIGLALLVIGAACAGWAITAGKGASRREAAGIAAATLVAGAFFIIQARLPEQNATAATVADAATIQRGQSVYLQQCLACHGVTGKGDGPQAASMSVAPANLTDPIHLLHGDAWLEQAVKNGFPASGMPAFGEILNDQQVADVVAYIKSLSIGNAASIDVPDAADCTVEPRDLNALMSGTPPAEATTEINLGPLPIAWPTGEAASTDETAAITATLHTFVACINANDYPRRLALSTTSSLEPIYDALDADQRATVIASIQQTPTPLADTDREAIVSIGAVHKLDDGRIGALVTMADPVNHPHEVAVVFIFKQENGTWLIDEARAPASASGSPTATETPFVVAWPLTASLSGYDITFKVSEGPSNSRPVVLTIRNSNGDAIDGATIEVVLTPRGVGLPSDISLTNVDPGTYAGKASLPATGVIEADITITLPGGGVINPAFTFPAN